MDYDELVNKLKLNIDVKHLDIELERELLLNDQLFNDDLFLGVILNKNNVLTPSAYRNFQKPSKRRVAKEWNTQMIDSILKNKVYTGNLVQNKIRNLSYKLNKKIRIPKEEQTIVKNTHRAIVSRREYELVNKILYSRDIRPKANKSYDLFAGYLKCGDCGHNMKFKKAYHKNNEYKYYYCNNYYRNKLCTPNKINGDDLEAVVIKSINHQINLFSNVSDIIDDVIKKERIDYNDEILKTSLKKQEKQIDRFKTLLKEIETDFEEDILSKDHYNSFKEQYTKKLKALSLKYNETINSSKLKNKNHLPKNLNKFKNGITNLNRNTLNELVDIILIKQDNKINIKFKYRDEFQMAIDFIKKSKNML